MSLAFYCPDCESEWHTEDDMAVHRQDCAIAWRNERDQAKRQLKIIEDWCQRRLPDDGPNDPMDGWSPALGEVRVRVAAAEYDTDKAQREATAAKNALRDLHEDWQPTGPISDEDGCCVSCGRGIEPCDTCISLGEVREKAAREEAKRLADLLVEYHDALEALSHEAAITAGKHDRIHNELADASALLARWPKAEEKP